MYNAKSMKAEEFICHEEILDTLAYAEANKNNKELLEQIIAKAKLRKGLSHREASVLLACEDEKLVQEMFALAEQIKKDFYGNRIVLFAPLYLSNYCINHCVYCPYHAKNKHIGRKKLTQAEVDEIKAADGFGLNDIYTANYYVYLIDSDGNPASWHGFYNNLNNGVDAPYIMCPLHNQSSWEEYQPGGTEEDTTGGWDNSSDNSSDGGWHGGWDGFVG